MQEAEFTTGQIKPIEIFKESWELMKDRFWLIFGIVIVGLLIGGAVPVVLIGPMMCGVFLVLFRVIDRQEIGFEHLFKGFDYFWKSLLVSVVIMAPILVLVFAIYIPIIGMAIAGQKMSEKELMPFLIGTVAVEVVVAFVMVCFHTLIVFAFPLVAERGLTSVEALKLSARAVWHNLSGMAGLFGVGMLVAMAGYLVFCIGVYLAVPIILMSQAVAYRRIFGRSEVQSYDPPPPTAYQGIS